MTIGHKGYVTENKVWMVYLIVLEIGQGLSDICVPYGHDGLAYFDYSVKTDSYLCT